MQTLPRLRDCSAAVSNSPAPDDRTRTARGLPAPFEPDWRRLLPYPFDGEQLLGYSTHDLDFVVQFPATAVPLIFQEFSGDFYIEEAAVRAVYEPPHQFNAIDTRSALKVDFWLAGSEPFDQEMLRRRFQATLFGEPAWISTAEDVILSKLLWNRISPSDRLLGDAAGIVAVQAVALDTDYLRRWAGELHLSDELKRVLTEEIKPKDT